MDASVIEEDLAFLREEEIVVTAMRHEQPISEAPSNMYVITEEDIRLSGAIDLPTLFRRVPGMEVMQMTGADFNVSMRGDNQTSANKVLVLVDGRSIYVDAQGVVNWKGLPVTLPEIKRIEILKGPASAVHGFNAFDGVIHIITKKPEEMKGVRAQTGMGEFDTVSSTVSYGGELGPLGFIVAGGYDQTSEWEDRDDLAQRSYTLNIQSQYEMGHEMVGFLRGGIVDVDRYDGPVTETVASKQDFTDGYVHAGVQHADFSVQAFWRRIHNNLKLKPFPSLQPFLSLTDSKGSNKNEADLNTYDIEAQHTVQIFSSHRVVYGVNYRYNTISSNFLDQYRTENRLGLFIQDEWKVTPAFIADFSFRLDLNTFINPTYSPRVALLYRPWSDHTFRVTGGLAYRPPTLTETYTDLTTVTTLPLPIPPIRVSVKGVDSLSPEQIYSFELGYQGWFWNHRVRFRIDGFYNHISDLIRPAGAVGNVAVFENGGEADIYGGEAGIEILVTPWLSGFVNYAYQDFGQTFVGTDRRSGPHSKINGGLRGLWDNGLNAEIVVHYVGSTNFPVASSFSSFEPFGVVAPDSHVDSYTLLNLRAGYSFWNDQAETAISVFNALNDRHQEHPLGETIKSRVLGWLTLKFH